MGGRPNFIDFVINVLGPGQWVRLSNLLIAMFAQPKLKPARLVRLKVA